MASTAPPSDTINFTSGVISGGLSGSFSATGTTQGYPPPAGTLSGSGTLSDGSTFTITSGGFGGPLSGGNIQFSGTSSDGDTVTGSGTFSGTEDQNYNITSGTFTITTFTVLDPNTWEPVSDGDYLWSDPENWSSHVVPVNGASATFNGAFNSECIVDTNTSQGLLTLQNGYNAPFQIQGNGAALNIMAYDDSNNAGGTFYVNFLAANAPINFKAGTITFNNSIDFGTGGKVNVLGGCVLNLGNGKGQTQTSGSPINVTNGTITFGANPDGTGLNTFQLSNASADIYLGPNGKMTLYDTRTDLIDSGGNGAVINNSGSITLKGIANNNNNIITGVNVPIQNHGTVNINGGRWWFNTSDASGDDISMDAGTIQLNGNAVVKISKYTQTGGSFQIMDNSETFTGSFGLYFKGGTVQFTSTTGYGSLSAENVVFNGATLNMRIDGNSQSSDLISCSSCTIQGNSTINVTMVGELSSYGPWILIQNPAGQNITGDFATKDLPLNISEYPVTNTWSCYSGD